MTRSRPLKLAALALLVLGLGLGTPVGLAQRTITVCPQGCQYAKIQEAITAASEGDTIQVGAGTYQENLTITKRLTLQGEGKDKVTIQGTVTILSTKLVTLSGFTVKGGQGVYIEDSTTVVLSDNAFVESTAEGLLARSSSITVRGNLISRNKSHGLLLVLGSRALITGNTITSNGGDGINIVASQADIRDNIVRDNGGCGVRADADSTVTGSVTSANFGGNQGGGLCDKAVKLDTEPPQVSCQPPDTTRWYREDVSVPCTASDSLSGLANSADASFTLIARGEGQAVSTGTRTVADRAGNSVTAGPYTFQIDKTPPKITYTLSSQPNIWGWYNTDVTVSFQCEDALSGVASCSSPVTVSQEGKDLEVRGEAVDKVGNRSATTVRVNIDKTPPTGSLTINDGAATTSSTRVTLKIQANDPLSGVAEMRFSNDGRTWSDWEGFQSTRSWDLTRFGGSSSDGLKTVYAQVRDRAGNVSQTFSATIRLINTLTGHTGDVNSVAFSPDGRLLASGSNDDTIKLWDVASGSEVRTLTGHTDHVTSVAFSPDGRLLASGSNDDTIKLWDVASGSEVRTLSGHTSDVNSVAFSPDGRLLASGGCQGGYVDDRIQLWDVSSGQRLRLFQGHTDCVHSVAFSPDGRLLASGSADKTIKLWDVTSGREVRTLSGHTSWVNSVAFSPDGRLLASGSLDQTIRLWEVATGREVRTLTGHTYRVNSVAFSPDGRLLASGSDDKTIRLWDISDLVGR
jgi:WD40 repeat protein